MPFSFDICQVYSFDVPMTVAPGISTLTGISTLGGSGVGVISWLHELRRLVAKNAIMRENRNIERERLIIFCMLQYSQFLQ